MELCLCFHQKIKIFSGTSDESDDEEEDDSRQDLVTILLHLAHMTRKGFRTPTPTHLTTPE